MQDETVFYICTYLCVQLHQCIYLWLQSIHISKDGLQITFIWLSVYTYSTYVFVCTTSSMYLCLFKRWIANYIYMTICVYIFYICINTYMTCYETYCFQLPGNGNSFSTRKVLIKLEEKHYMYYTRITTRIEKHRAWYQVGRWKEGYISTL